MSKGKDDLNEAVGTLFCHKKMVIRMAVGLLIVVLVAVIAILSAVYQSSMEHAEKEKQRAVEKALAEAAQDEVAITDPVTQEFNIQVLEKEIQEIGELASVEYLYTDVGKYEDAKKIFDFEIPMTYKSFIVKWDGVIKAGVDVTKLKATVDEAKKEIAIQIPEAEILSNESFPESLEVFDEKNNIFNPISVNDVYNVDEATKEAMSKRAIDNGILERAQDNAQSLIQSILEMNPTLQEGYTVVFDVQPNPTPSPAPTQQPAEDAQD